MYINLDYLKKITDNNKEMILNMINSYLELTPVSFEELKEAYANKDWDKVSALAHEIQSSAGILGNDELRLKLKALEEISTKQTNLDTLPPLMESIFMIHHRSLVEIETSRSSYMV